MNRIKLKMDSRADLRGRLILALQPLAIMILISYTVSIFGTLANKTSNADLATALNVINSCLSIAYAVVYFSLSVGVSRFYLKFINNENVTWATVFDDLKKPKIFAQEFAAAFISGIIIILGFVLFIVPGIYLTIRYSQMQYVFAEQPKTKWRDAMTRSADLIKGHYWEIFVLWLSFFWWYLLIAVTFGLASIYVAPYINCAMARYYKSLIYALDGNPDANDGNTFYAAQDTQNNNNPFDDTIYGTTVKNEKDGNPFEF